MGHILKNNRLLYIEPTLINDDGSGRSYIAPLEDYCIGVDLEMYYTKRDACGYGKYNNKVVKKGVDVSFFNGTDGKLTTNYTDVSMITPWKNTKECLGIKSIDITYNMDRYPMVTIVFTDVRGASLIGPTELKENYKEGEGSFFSMLYSMPTPRFKLKVKGFYGNTVTYDLAMQSSKLSFDAGTGNFDVTVEFIGYLYGIYADLPITYITLAPFLKGFGNEYWTSEVKDSKRFTFDDGNGNKTEMMPLPELRLKIAQASASPEMMDVLDKEKKTNQNFQDQIFLLRQLISKFPFNGWDCNSNGTYAFYVTDNSKYKDVVVNGAKSFNTSLNEYNTKYEATALKCFDYMKDVADKDGSLIFLELSRDLSLKKGQSYPTGLKNLIQKEAKKIFSGSSVTKVYAAIYPNKIKSAGIEEIQARLKTVEDSQKEAQKVYEDSKKQAVTNALGFPTTIKNVYNLIFAHMETFIGAFYTCLDKIIASDNSKRTPSYYGVSRDDTDCMDDYMPPFTGIYKDIEQEDGSKKRTMVWPGELTNGSEMPEVEFVESVLMGAHFYAEEEKAINKNIEILREESGESTDDLPNLENYSLDESEGNDFKLAIYMTLKRLYDKWICSGDKEQWKLTNDKDTTSDFSRFLYIDSFYHNIGNKLTINMEKMGELIARYMPTSFASGSNPNYSLYNFLSEIAQTNGATLMGFPITFGYNEETIEGMFTPQALNTSTIDDQSTFVVLYPYQYSQILDPIEAMNSGFKGDSFLLTENDGSISKTLPASMIDEGNYICSFGVSYGRQNQGMFKGLQLNMDAPQVTEAAIEGAMNVVATNGQGIREGVLYGQDIYSNYSNYAFEASMETMGNAQIMPLMYFQLNGIPMWRGTYMISKVSHSIVPGNMTTKFSGNRLSENTIPLVGGDLIYMTLSDVKVNPKYNPESPEYNPDVPSSLEEQVTTENMGADRMEECIRLLYKNWSYANRNPYNTESCHRCAGGVFRLASMYFLNKTVDEAIKQGGGDAYQIGDFGWGITRGGKSISTLFKTSLESRGLKCTAYRKVFKSEFTGNNATDSKTVLNKLGAVSGKPIKVGDVLVYYPVVNNSVMGSHFHTCLYTGKPSEKMMEGLDNTKRGICRREWASDFRQNNMWIYGKNTTLGADYWVCALFQA